MTRDKMIEALADAVSKSLHNSPKHGDLAAAVLDLCGPEPLVWVQTVDTRRGSFERRKWEAAYGCGFVYEIWDYDFVNWRGGEPASDAQPPEKRYCINLNARRRVYQDYRPTLEAAQAAAQAHATAAHWKNTPLGKIMGVK